MWEVWNVRVCVCSCAGGGGGQGWLGEGDFRAWGYVCHVCVAGWGGRGGQDKEAQARENACVVGAGGYSHIGV